MTFDAFHLVRPCTGESVAGDIAVTKKVDDGLLAAIVDVSGHGPEANELAVKLELEISNWPDADPRRLMQRLDQACTSSRGAAVGLVHFQSGGSLRYVGVGNTRIQKLGGKAWKGISKDGVLGNRMPTLREESVALNEGDVITLFTDGLTERISEKDHPQLALDTPPVIAQNLIKFFGKTYDDASCIVIKCRA